MTRVRRCRSAMVALALAGLCATRAEAARPHLGAEASALGGRLTFDSATLDYDPHYQLGWTAGSTIEMGIAPRWSLVSGLRFVQIAERQVVTVTTSGTGGTSTIHGTVRSWWSWVGLPVLARLHPPGVGPFYVEAGPEVRYLTSATMNSTVESTSSSPLTTGSRRRSGPAANIFEPFGTLGSDVDVTDQYRRVDVAALAGVGASHGFAGHPVAIHLRFAQGLLDLAKGEATRRSQALELGAGWSF